MVGALLPHGGVGELVMNEEDAVGAVVALAYGAQRHAQTRPGWVVLCGLICRNFVRGHAPASAWGLLGSLHAMQGG
jgi:hypothetical protein